MAAVSLPSGPVTALHPETEMAVVQGGCHGVWWGFWGVVGVDLEVTGRIIEEGGSH